MFNENAELLDKIGEGDQLWLDLQFYRLMRMSKLHPTIFTKRETVLLLYNVFYRNTKKASNLPSVNLFLSFTEAIVCLNRFFIVSIHRRLLKFYWLKMDSGFGESASKPPLSPSCSGSGGNDAGNFECNICFELAQDPIVTLCGHLFCWPCLYKWLHIHSHSQECPVCKALIQEEKLVPLYGRGKTSTDPRSKSIPGVNIPNRPAGQRPETAPPRGADHFPQQGFGFMGGFPPMGTARFGNFTLSAAFGGLIPSLFNVQVHGFPDATMYGAAAGFPYGFSNSFHGGHVHGFPQPTTQGQQADSYLKMLFLLIGALVILALCWS